MNLDLSLLIQLIRFNKTFFRKKAKQPSIDNNFFPKLDCKSNVLFFFLYFDSNKHIFIKSNGIRNPKSQKYFRSLILYAICLILNEMNQKFEVESPNNGFFSI